MHTTKLYNNNNNSKLYNKTGKPLYTNNNLNIII